MTDIDQAARLIRRVLNQDKKLLSACYAPSDPQFAGVIVGVNAALDALDGLVAEAKRLRGELEELRRLEQRNNY